MVGVPLTTVLADGLLSIVPISKADVKRVGHDISLIYGAMVHLALEAAELLAQEHIDLEIVDLRTLIPLDKDTIYESVRKTSKPILLHEDNKTGIDSRRLF